ncbi:OadG family transporter subunit [Salinimicrobium soli]|uniref:OadG family transporter subunit n=1 Tax=Salinimicrobium soli TaxID=1254399 RepID=UPI003AAEAB95
MNYSMMIVDWSEIWIITVVGYSVVFVALVLLVFCFQSLPKILGLGMNGAQKIRDSRAARAGAANEEKYLSGEVSAAIGMALTLYFKEQHDEESGVLTIKRVSRTYSPWSSKIYGVNNFPGKNY